MPSEPPSPEDRDESTTLRGPGEGRAARRRAAKRIKRRRRLSFTREIPILLGTALLIAWILKTFLVQAFVIPSGSMEQTIRIGDRVLVDKLTPWFGAEPERGDIVVFRDPGGWLDDDKQRTEDAPVVIREVKAFLSFIGLLPSKDEQDLIKRVVAIGGDTVACCDAKGRVTVNGTPLEEPYLYPGNEPSRIEFEVTVPRDRVFVMGDHRANSADSRYHLDEEGNGTVPEKLIVGRAMVIAWPVDHWRRLEEPASYAAIPEPEGDKRDTATAAAVGDNRTGGSPIPVGLSLVISVVGLARVRDGRRHSVRSGCGGRSGRRTLRFRGAGGCGPWRAARGK